MRVEFRVSGEGDQWTVRRGHTRALRYRSLENALTAAESLARAAADGGDVAVVTLLIQGGVAERRVIAPPQAGLRPITVTGP